MVQVAHKKPLNTLEKMSKRDQFAYAFISHEFPLDRITYVKVMRYLA